MACDIEFQLEAARSFGCLAPDEADLVALGQLLRLASLNGQTPAQLVEAARCLMCLDAKSLLSIQAALAGLIDWNTVGGDVLGTEAGDIIGTEAGDWIGLG